MALREWLAADPARGVQRATMDEIRLTAAGFKAYRHRPTKVVAVVITTENIETLAEICDGWVGSHEKGHSIPLLWVPSLQGDTAGYLGDYLIWGPEVGWYAIKPNVMANAYEGEAGGPNGGLSG
jgi:hypothetical protein